MAGWGVDKNVPTMNEPAMHDQTPDDPHAHERPERAATLDARIASLTGALRVAQTLVQAGRAIDLRGLREQVGVLCAQALDLSPEAGGRAVPGLEALGVALAGLEAALRAAEPAA